MLYVHAGVLEFQVRPHAPADYLSAGYFSVDEFLKYTPFFADYGPPNLGKVSQRL